MKIFLDDIKRIEWLKERIIQQKWGNTFINLKRGFFFVFDYNLKESHSIVEITRARYLSEINEGIYRDMRGEHVGYMSEPFDTSNYLLYSILKGVCVTSEEENKLTDLFISYKSKDLAVNKQNLKVLLKGSQDISSNISFSTALNNVFSINKKPVHGLCMVYDLIDAYTRRVHNKSIYGEMLSKIVRAIKNPNGGLLPEYAGSTMRYLIIGEKAAHDDIDLKKAKELLRSGNTPYSIFLETQWYFNKHDNKWRKRISDDTFLFDLEKITSGDNSFYYKPDDVSRADFDSWSKQLASGQTTMAKIVASGYNVRLGDFIKFEEAFELYPNLKSIYSFFALNTLKDSSYSFYFMPQTPFSLVLIAGTGVNYDLEKIKYTALHEIQHYVQEVEGFGSGGNDNIASLVDAVGGSAVKMFFISLAAFQKRFSEVAAFIPVEKFTALVTELAAKKYNSYNIRHKNSIIDVSEYYRSIISSLSRLTATQQSISDNNNSISYYILTLYSMITETNESISNFIIENVGEDYISLFNQALEQNKKTVERDAGLLKKGWTPQDLYILNFQAYESLLGEVESRFTQQTANIPKELKNYFEFYTSETIDSSSVSVINEDIIKNNGKKYEAALEKCADGKYIIHLPESFSNSINLLHETGHILYDFVVQEVLVNPDSGADAVMADFDSIEEYFCASFVDYIHRKDIDPMLTNDLSSERTILNLKGFDELFEKVLYSESEVDESGIIIRLNFVMKILE